MATRIKDLAVKTGEYTDKNGDKKSRYENVGSLWDGDNGKFITLKKTFNPAGLETAPGKDQIIISIFDLRDNNQQQAQPKRQAPTQDSHNTAKSNGYQAPADDFDSDLPF